MQFGSRERFAIEVGPRGTCPEVRDVDVWAAGRWLTCDDNSVLVSCFASRLQYDLARLMSPCDDDVYDLPFADLSVTENHEVILALAEEDNTLHLRHRFMDWGETADNVSMHIFRWNGTVLLPFSFWRETHHATDEVGVTFCAELPEDEFHLVLHQAAQELKPVSRQT